jgi:hypothetical protein
MSEVWCEFCEFGLISEVSVLEGLTRAVPVNVYEFCDDKATCWVPRQAECSCANPLYSGNAV